MHYAKWKKVDPKGYIQWNSISIRQGKTVEQKTEPVVARAGECLEGLTSLLHN